MRVVRWLARLVVGVVRRVRNWLTFRPPGHIEGSGQVFWCWNGPKEGEIVTDVPLAVQTGYACAMPWRTVNGESRYAVYILLEKPGGDRGLVYERSYDKPFKAQQRVQQITATVDRMTTPA